MKQATTTLTRAVSHRNRIDFLIALGKSLFLTSKCCIIAAAQDGLAVKFFVYPDYKSQIFY